MQRASGKRICNQVPLFKKKKRTTQVKVRLTHKRIMSDFKLFKNKDFKKSSWVLVNCDSFCLCL